MTFKFYARGLKRNSEMALGEMGDNEKRLRSPEYTSISYGKKSVIGLKRGMAKAGKFNSETKGI